MLSLFCCGGVGVVVLCGCSVVAVLRCCVAVDVVVVLWWCCGVIIVVYYSYHINIPNTKRLCIYYA